MNCSLCPQVAHNELRFCSAMGVQLVNRNKLIRQLAVGTYLYEEGQPAEGLFCLSQGKILLEKVHGQHIYPLRFCKPGEILGLGAVFGNQGFTHRARAMEASTVCLIPAAEARILMMQEPHFNQQVMRLLIAEIEDLERRLTHIAEQNVEQRVADLILLVWKTYGLTPDGHLPLTLSPGSIAQMAGTTPRTAHQVCQQFSQQGWISLDPSFHISLMQPEALSRVVG